MRRRRVRRMRRTRRMRRRIRVLMRILEVRAGNLDKSKLKNK